MSSIRFATLAAVALLAGCYFQVGGRDVHLKPDELWREARQACHRRDPRAQRFMLERIVDRYPSSDYAPPARQHLQSLPTCSSGDDSRPYPQNIGPGGSDSTSAGDHAADHADDPTSPSSESIPQRPDYSLVFPTLPPDDEPLSSFD